MPALLYALRCVKIVYFVRVSIKKMNVHYRDLNYRALYKCQGHLLQSEVLPILSSSSRKNESNAVSPSQSGYKFVLWRQFFQVVWHVPMTRATCHFVSIQISYQPRSHRLPMWNVIGPVQIGSAVQLQWLNSSNHVPRAIGPCQVAQTVCQSTS